MNFTRPAITPGQWIIAQDAPENPKSRYAIAAPVAGKVCKTYVCTIKTEKHLTLDGCETANAQAISSIPAILSALEASFTRACEAVAAAHAIRSDDPDTDLGARLLWESECAIRDEYKAALQSAGYSFP